MRELDLFRTVGCHSSDLPRLCGLRKETFPLLLRSHVQRHRLLSPRSIIGHRGYRSSMTVCGADLLSSGSAPRPGHRRRRRSEAVRREGSNTTRLTNQQRKSTILSRPAGDDSAKTISNYRDQRRTRSPLKLYLTT